MTRIVYSRRKISARVSTRPSPRVVRWMVRWVVSRVVRRAVRRMAVKAARRGAVRRAVRRVALSAVRRLAVGSEVMAVRSEVRETLTTVSARMMTGLLRKISTRVAMRMLSRSTPLFGVKKKGSTRCATDSVFLFLPSARTIVDSRSGLNCMATGEAGLWIDPPAVEEMCWWHRCKTIQG